METAALPAEASQAVGRLRRADIVIGIPSYNNAGTIAQVVRAAQTGLARYFPQFTAVIVNSDGGSKDGTQETVLGARVEDPHLLLVTTPLTGAHQLSFPDHGVLGKGSAFQLVFQIAGELNAKACAVVDAGLRSITPEWIDLLIRPVLYAGYDFVAPYYHRHKYDGTLINSILYPMTRALYGKRIRHPAGGDFGFSPALVARYLRRNDWDTDVARYGTDVWMTTIAVAERFRICQSFLGARLHQVRGSGSDLSAMLYQVVGSVVPLMEEYEDVWKARRGSDEVDLFGFRYDVGLDPVDVDLEGIWGLFRHGCRELREVWERALEPETLAGVLRLGATSEAGASRLEDELWVRVLYEFAHAAKAKPMERRYLLRSLAPLYLAWVASFVLETRDSYAAQVEDRMEALCRQFEHDKPYLAALWNEERPGQPGKQAGAELNSPSPPPPPCRSKALR